MDFKNFKLHRPVDSSDPGFSIPGVRFRWTSGRVREISETSMMWTPFRKDRLPKELVEHIERVYPGAFAQGDTIRRGSGELILSYMTTEQAKKQKEFLSQKSLELQNKTRSLPKQEYVGARDYAKITENEESASSIPRQFLKKNEE